MFAGLNWIDWTIIVIVAYYAFTGWEAGFADLGFSFVTFIISLWLAIKFHSPVGDFLSTKFAIPSMWTEVMGYVIVGFIAEAILSEIASLILAQIPARIAASKANKLLGVIVSAFNGVVLVSFVLLVIMALPLRGTVKQDVQNSKIGGYFLAVAQKFGGPIQSTINDARDSAIKFLTVEPTSTESINLNFTVQASDLVVDSPDEQAMLALVNGERTKVGVAPLQSDVPLIIVARAHSKDMFLRHYFSHVTPEGLTPGDRMEKAQIDFTAAGENIAYAPDLATAHTGLMNSPGHKANILDPAFHHIGIGIVSTNSLGIMVTQDFTN